jgi:hypothetical protein
MPLITFMRKSDAIGWLQDGSQAIGVQITTPLSRGWNNKTRLYSYVCETRLQPSGGS